MAGDGRLRGFLGRTILVVATIAPCGCATRGARSPTALRASYLTALARDDPRGAYELLSPEVRARVSLAEFTRRWKVDAAQRQAIRQAADSVPADSEVGGHQATTIHRDGAVLSWAQVGSRWLVTDGLPGKPGASTPQAAVRSLLRAVTALEWTELRTLLTEELAAELATDWRERSEAIRAALDRPGALELSRDLRRAQLRYDQRRTVRLEQRPGGWRITSLE